jgi:hypothetical protein
MKLYISMLALCLSIVGCNKSGNSDGVTPTPDPIEDESMDGDPDIGDLTIAGTFYDKFEGTLDESKWVKMNRIWGQPTNPLYQHGGVIPENISTRAGHAVLRALGDKYTGTLRGAGGQAKRLGSVIHSKQRFASGRYEIKMRVLQNPDQGVLSSAWTFWYKEITPISHPDAYQKALSAGNVERNGKIILNHEIDIEVKGANLGNPLYTNWIGELSEEHRSKAVVHPGLNDGKFHIYRWDWHTGGNGEEARVEYYLDNNLIHVSKEKVPYLASQIYIGNWFAWWAGNDSGTYKAPEFESSEMFVDWVKFVPFNQPNDDFFE